MDPYDDFQEQLGLLGDGDSGIPLPEMNLEAGELDQIATFDCKSSCESAADPDVNICDSSAVQKAACMQLWQAIAQDASNSTKTAFMSDIGEAFEILSHPDAVEANISTFVFDSNPQQDVSLLSNPQSLRYATSMCFNSSEVDPSGTHAGIFDSESSHTLLIIPSRIHGALSYGCVAKRTTATHCSHPKHKRASAVVCDTAVGRFVRNETTGEILIISHSTDDQNMGRRGHLVNMLSIFHMYYPTSTKRASMKSALEPSTFNAGDTAGALRRHTKGVQTRICPVCNSLPRVNCGCVLPFQTPSHPLDFGVVVENSKLMVGDFTGPMRSVIHCEDTGKFYGVNVMSRSSSSTFFNGAVTDSLHQAVLQNRMSLASPVRSNMSPSAALYGMEASDFLVRSFSFDRMSISSGGMSIGNSGESSLGLVPLLRGAGDLENIEDNDSLLFAPNDPVFAAATNSLHFGDVVGKVHGDEVAASDHVVVDLAEQPTALDSNVGWDIGCGFDTMLSPVSDEEPVPTDGLCAVNSLAFSLLSTAEVHNCSLGSDAACVASDCLPATPKLGLALDVSARAVFRKSPKPPCLMIGAAPDFKLELVPHDYSEVAACELERKDDAVLAEGKPSVSLLNEEACNVAGPEQEAYTLPELASTSPPLTAAEKAEARVELRKQKNRLAAARSNQRRKERNASLRANLKEVREQSAVLRVREEALRQENAALRSLVESK
jgi:hypothetical protein